MSGFTMFPEWLRAQKPEPAEVVAYLALAAFGTFNPSTGKYDECRPSIPTLADETGLSENTLRKAIRSLLGRGALEAGGKRYDERGGQLPTIYRVVFGVVTPPQNLNQGGADSEVAPVQPDTPGGVPKSEGNQEPSTKNPNTKKPSASPRGTRLPEDWMPSEKTRQWCADELPAELYARAGVELTKFRNYWCAKTGKDATKVDWERTFQNWMINARDRYGTAPVSGPPASVHRFPSAGERNAQYADQQMSKARRAQELIDGGMNSREAYKRAAEEIAQISVQGGSPIGYINGEVIDNGQREVTAK